MLESLKAVYKKFKERNFPSIIIEGVDHTGGRYLKPVRLKKIPQVSVLNDETYKYHLIKQENGTLEAFNKFRGAEAEIETLIFKVEKPRVLFTRDGRIFIEEGMKKEKRYLQDIKDTESSVKEFFANLYN